MVAMIEAKRWQDLMALSSMFFEDHRLDREPVIVSYLAIPCQNTSCRQLGLQRQNQPTALEDHEAGSAPEGL